MVDAHVYRGHFPCGLFGCLAIPLDQQGDAHVFTLGLCDNGEPCFAKVQSFNVKTADMDFKDSIKQISERIESLKDNLKTEEATKTALILPFLSALGYDVFNPLEVLPEMSCDIGMKKGEKIDYAILKDGEPIILIECKHWEQDLNLYDNQLIRYFNVSKAKFGVLTNGIIYKFYTDLAEPNKMDEKPFLEVNLLEVKDAQVEELKKFHRSYFDVDNILSSASELKYMGELKAAISKEFANPSPDFVRFFGKQVYDGVFSQKVLEQFTALTKRTIGSYINDIISDRLKAAIKTDEEATATEQKTAEKTEEQPTEPETNEDGIVTTEEELEAFFIVKSIIRSVVTSDRITYKDTRSYFGVQIDNNVRKTVVRFYFNQPKNKRIAIISEDKSERMYKVQTLDEIYNYADELTEAAKRYV